MTGALRTPPAMSRARQRGSRWWCSLLFACCLLAVMPRPARGTEPATRSRLPDGVTQHDQFVHPDLFCEYQISNASAAPAASLRSPPVHPQLLSILPAGAWNNIVRVYVDCWIPRRSWSSLRHLLEGRYHDRLFGMISHSYVVTQLGRTDAGSLNDPRLLRYLLEAFTTAPERGQKVLPRKLAEEVRLGLGAQLMARALTRDGRREPAPDQLAGLWKEAAPPLEPPAWRPETLGQLQMLTRDAVSSSTPFWRRTDPILEVDRFLMQRYSFYRSPSSPVRPRPLTQAWDLLHLRSVHHTCNDLVPGGRPVDRSKCPPSSLLWEKVAGQSGIQHTLVLARYGTHNGVEGTRVSMDWFWDFSYVMFPFNLQIVKDTIRAYCRSLIRGFYTLPRE